MNCCYCVVKTIEDRERLVKFLDVLGIRWAGGQQASDRRVWSQAVDAGENGACGIYLETHSGLHGEQRACLTYGGVRKEHVSIEEFMIQALYNSGAVFVRHYGPDTFVTLYDKGRMFHGVSRCAPKDIYSLGVGYDVARKRAMNNRDGKRRESGEIIAAMRSSMEREQLTDYVVGGKK